MRINPKNTGRLLSLVLLASMILGAASCGQAENPSGGDTSAPTGGDSEETTAEEPKGYQYYEGVDLGGQTFTVWNVKKDLWNMHCAIAPDEISGETVNDAIYNRNAKVETQMNFELKEENAESYDQMGNQLAKLILANDPTYDAVYMPMYLVGGGLSQGYYRSLDEISTIHLDEDWWDQVFLDATSIGGDHFFATSNAHLMGWDGLWCLLFNENMMDNLGLEYPYQLVRDGKWTLDKFDEYCQAAANLNGDDAFKLDAAGNSVFGCVSFHHVAMKFLFGFDVDFVSKDKDDLPVFDCGDKFVKRLPEARRVLRRARQLPRRRSGHRKGYILPELL